MTCSACCRQTYYVCLQHAEQAIRLLEIFRSPGSTCAAYTGAFTLSASALWMEDLALEDVPVSCIVEDLHGLHETRDVIEGPFGD